MNGEYVVNQVQKLWKEKKYKVIVLGIVAVLMLTTFVKLGHGNILELRNTTGCNYWLVLYIIIGIFLFGGFGFYICKLSKRTIEKIYLMIAILFGILFMTILPPYSIIPVCCWDSRRLMMMEKYYIEKTIWCMTMTIIFRRPDHWS